MEATYLYCDPCAKRDKVVIAPAVVSSMFSDLYAICLNASDFNAIDKMKERLDAGERVYIDETNSLSPYIQRVFTVTYEIFRNAKAKNEAEANKQ